MGRPSKPNKKCGSVQPYEPLKLSDDLIRDMQCVLSVSKEEMDYGVTIDVEHSIAVYKAELIILDGRPSQASVNAEIKPILKIIDKLYNSIESLSPFTMESIRKGELNKSELPYSFSDELINLSRLKEALKSGVISNTESRGNNEHAAEHNLIVSLFNIYKRYSHNKSEIEEVDFISEVLESACRLDISIIKIKKIIKNAG
ncbi:MAG: hypothetical protein R8M45_10160 [Ghiorsea sp.]